MSTNYTPPYPIPYEHDTCYQQPPVRVLFSEGRWCVPECERPANWRKMTATRDVEPAAKAPYLPVNPPRSQWNDTPSHLTPKRGAGRPSSTALTVDQVAAYTAAGMTCAAIAKIGKCNVAVIVKMRQKTNVTRPCKVCHKPTGRAANVMYCAACLPKRRVHRKGQA